MDDDRFELVKASSHDGVYVEILCDGHHLIYMTESDEGEYTVSLYETIKMSREDFEKFIQLIDEGTKWLWSKQ